MNVSSRKQFFETHVIRRNFDDMRDDDEMTK